MKNISANKILFALILIIAVLNCSSAATNLTINQDNSNAKTNPAPTITRIIAPAALVADLYKQHDAHKSPFFQTKNRALVDKYFTKTTANLIWKDATTTKEEVGALDGDPLYDAQDVEIKNFAVGKAKIKGKSATVAVKFENFGKKITINFALVQENGNWKIEDIKYSEGTSLVKLLKENSSGNSKNKSE